MEKMDKRELGRILRIKKEIPEPENTSFEVAKKVVEKSSSRLKRFAAQSAHYNLTTYHRFQQFGLPYLQGFPFADAVGTVMGMMLKGQDDTDPEIYEILGRVLTLYYIQWRDNDGPYHKSIEHNYQWFSSAPPSLTVSSSKRKKERSKKKKKKEIMEVSEERPKKKHEIIEVPEEDSELEIL